MEQDHGHQPDGPMRLTKAVAPIMKAQGRGRIINIASVAGLSPTGSSIAYAVSKAGLIHLTRCTAVALAPETLVNCVAPSLLDGTRATANLRSEQIERSASGSLHDSHRPAASYLQRSGRLGAGTDRRHFEAGFLVTTGQRRQLPSFCWS
jgi:NAD(P)-dependent dehydrogenase (short-subunit alcohol dehydrogenase family)